MYTYIVTDDEVPIRKGLIAKLRQAADLPVTCVGEATGGRRALELMEELHPDILITDMRMSDMDGVELLEQMHRNYPDVPVIVISGYKLFDYVKQAIEKRAIGYVLKPFSAQEIAQQMEKAINQLESHSQIQRLRQEAAELDKKRRRDVLAGAMMRRWNPQTENALAEAGYSLRGNYLLVSVLAQPPGILERLEHLCAAKGFEDTATLVENPLDSHQCMVLLHGPAGGQALGAMAKRLTRCIEEYLDATKLVFAVSSPFDTLQQLNTFQLKNENAFNFIFPALRVQTIEADAVCEASLSPYTEEAVDVFFREMRTRSQKLDEVLRQFFNGLAPQTTTWGEIAAACSLLLEKVNGYALHNQVERQNLMDGFFARHACDRTLDGVRDAMSGYIQGVLSAVRLKKNGQQNLFNQINDYLQKNYRYKVTLQTLASKFYVSSAQCSSLIRETLNVTFNDYLGQIRIEKAKQLLATTHLSAKEISAEVGYPNPKYFFKVFRTVTGLTPLEYRERYNTRQNR